MKKESPEKLEARARKREAAEVSLFLFKSSVVFAFICGLVVGIVIGYELRWLFV